MKLICALSQGMYWFRVMRADIARERGDVSVVPGRRIAAAPSVEFGLRRLLIEAGIDPAKDDLRVAPLEGLPKSGRTSFFSQVAVRALEDQECAPPRIRQHKAIRFWNQTLPARCWHGSCTIRLHDHASNPCGNDVSAEGAVTIMTGDLMFGDFRVRRAYLGG